MDLLRNMEVIMKPNPFFSKFTSVCRLLYYFPSFLWHNSAKKSISRVLKVVNHLRSGNSSNKFIAGIGYCWGGRVVVKMAQGTSPAFDAICANHPGGLSFPSDIEAISRPACFVLPELDMEIKADKVQAIRDILDANKASGLLPLSQVRFYKGMVHGFAVRGDESNPAVLAERKDAFSAALAFFRSASSPTLTPAATK
jgi:dienelactone hydrolase